MVVKSVELAHSGSHESAEEKLKEMSLQAPALEIGAQQCATSPAAFCDCSELGCVGWSLVSVR